MLFNPVNTPACARKSEKRIKTTYNENKLTFPCAEDVQHRLLPHIRSEGQSWEQFPEKYRMKVKNSCNEYERE